MSGAPHVFIILGYHIDRGHWLLGDVLDCLYFTIFTLPVLQYPFLKKTRPFKVWKLHFHVGE